MRPIFIATIITCVLSLTKRPLPYPAEADIAAYLKYSKTLVKAARPVSRNITSHFTNFISTLSLWSHAFVGASVGSVAGAIFGGWSLGTAILGPYLGLGLGGWIGNKVGGVTNAIAGVGNAALTGMASVVFGDVSGEFSMAKDGLEALHAALDSTSKDTALMESVNKVDAYLHSVRNKRSDKYKKGLQAMYEPAAANLRLFWETEEKVCTVLAGGKSLASAVQHLGNKIEALTPWGLDYAVRLATIFSTRIITHAVGPSSEDQDKGEVETLLSYLETARSTIATLEARDAYLRSTQGLLRRIR